MKLYIHEKIYSVTFFHVLFLQTGNLKNEGTLLPVHNQLFKGLTLDANIRYSLSAGTSGELNGPIKTK